MPPTEPAIANYDDHTADEIKQRLRKLSQADLNKLEAHEKQGQARSTVLEAIAALRTEAPWSGYDEMEVAEVNLRLEQRDGDAAGRVLDYERHHKARTGVIEFAKRRQEAGDGSSGSPSGATRSSGSGQTKRSQGTRARSQSNKPSTTRSSQSGTPAIANYDNQTAGEIAQRLRGLSQSDLAEVEAYEKQGQGRRTVLETIAALRGDEPWSGYDDMEVEEVNDALKQRDGETAGRVLAYERHHKGRKTIIELARTRGQANEGSSAPKSRSRSSKPSSRPKRAASKSSSATSRGGSAPRSTGGRSAKAPTSRTRAKTTSRPSATRSSGSQQAKSPRAGSRPRSQPKGTSRPRTQSRKPAAIRMSREHSTTRSHQSESRAKEALQAAGAKLRERATQALRSAEGPTKKMAKDTGVAVGSAAQAAPTKIRDRATEALQTAEGPTRKLAKETEQAVESAAQDGRDAVETALRGTGEAVAAAANRARTPALVGAATLATVGGGIALGSKVRLRRRKTVLGVPVPRRSAVGKAAKRIGKAVDSASSTGQQIGQWSDDVQYLRQRIAGADAAGRSITPRAVARRILC